MRNSTYGYRRSAELDVNSPKMPRIIHGIEILMKCLIYVNVYTTRKYDVNATFTLHLA